MTLQKFHLHPLCSLGKHFISIFLNLSHYCYPLTFPNNACFLIAPYQMKIHIKWKFIKWLEAILRLTKTKLIYPSQLSHTLRAITHSKKKTWFIISSSLLHKGHCVLGTSTGLLIKLTRGGSLPSRTLPHILVQNQPLWYSIVTWTKDHRRESHLPLELCNQTQQYNSSVGSPSSHSILSLPSFCHRELASSSNNCTSNSFSHTKKSLLQCKHQLKPTTLPMITRSPISHTTSSTSKDSEYNLGNFHLSGSFPIHLSSQNLIYFPSTNFKLILLSNQLQSFCTSHVLHKSFHQKKIFFFPSMVIFMPLHCAYLESSISLHTPPSSTRIFYFHLTNSVMYICIGLWSQTHPPQSGYKPCPRLAIFSLQIPTP